MVWFVPEPARCASGLMPHRRERELLCPTDLPLLPWVVAYGISDNTRAFWSLESARRQLGYAPQDDAEVVYAADVRQLLMNGAPAASGRLGPPAA